jgi:hypothetical protein
MNANFKLFRRRQRNFKNKNGVDTITTVPTTVQETTTTVPTTTTTPVPTTVQTTTVPSTQPTTVLSTQPTTVLTTVPTTVQRTVPTTVQTTIPSTSTANTVPIATSNPAGIPLIPNSRDVLDNKSQIIYPNINPTNYVPTTIPKHDTYCYRDPDTQRIVCNNSIGFIDYAFKYPSSYQLNLSINRTMQETKIINPIFNNADTQVNYCNLICQRNTICQGYKATYDTDNKQYYCDFYRSNLNIINNLLAIPENTQKKIDNPEPISSNGKWSSYTKKN